MDREAIIIEQLEESIRLKGHLQENAKTIIAIADQLVQALKNGNKVLLFGNGGSAADAQHFAAELMGKFALEREALPAIALTTDTSVITAISNDCSYDNIFSRQVQGLAREGDVVIGISTSGRSENVLRGMEEARRLGAITIAFTGEGGKLRDLADHVLSVPSTDTPRIQEAHAVAGHIVCFLVEDALFNSNKHV
jgi:D-sedoheptulose 7-phosphate isomerase